MASWIQFGVIVVLLGVIAALLWWIIEILSDPRSLLWAVRNAEDRVVANVCGSLDRLSAEVRDTRQMPVLWVLPEDSSGSNWRIINVGHGPARNIKCRYWSSTRLPSVDRPRTTRPFVSLLPVESKVDLSGEVREFIEKWEARFRHHPDELNELARKALYEDARVHVRLDYESLESEKYSTDIDWSEGRREISFRHHTEKGLWEFFRKQEAEEDTES